MLAIEDSATNHLDLGRAYLDGSLGSTRRCPHCGDANVRWFGILRVCAACERAFHWRDAVVVGS
jgi:uncharacterized protein (DUF983 family)